MENKGWRGAAFLPEQQSGSGFAAQAWRQWSWVAYGWMAASVEREKGMAECLVAQGLWGWRGEEAGQAGANDDRDRRSAAEAESAGGFESRSWPWQSRRTSLKDDVAAAALEVGTYVCY